MSYMSFKIGLDLHGVIDADPEHFAALSKAVIAMGGEVHIITGSMATEALFAWLKERGIKYTKVFSISSYHAAEGTKMNYDERGPWMDSEIWNRSKAEYCSREGIDLHIDDSDVYGKYFATPYLRWTKKGISREGRG